MDLLVITRNRQNCYANISHQVCWSIAIRPSPAYKRALSIG